MTVFSLTPTENPNAAPLVRSFGLGTRSACLGQLWSVPKKTLARPPRTPLGLRSPGAPTTSVRSVPPSVMASDEPKRSPASPPGSFALSVHRTPLRLRMYTFPARGFPPGLLFGAPIAT
jgi:hypothetical protein